MSEAEQWRPEVEEVAEAGLKAIDTKEVLAETAVSPKEVANGNGLHKNGDAHVEDILGFDDTDTDVNGTTNGNESFASQLETGESSRNDGEVVEEEIVELEFEKVKPKLTTHSMHCPNCKSEITKVVLRRKVLSYRPTLPQVDTVVSEPTRDPEGLVGCLSCLSLFTCSDNGCFNPFDIFKRRPAVSSIDTATSPNDGENTTPQLQQNESCLSMFWIIRKGTTNMETNQGADQQSETAEGNPQSLISGVKPTIVNRESIITPSPAKSHTFVEGTTSFVEESSSNVHDLPRNIDATLINIENDGETRIVPQPRGRPWLGSDGILVEILKSIVYGGLMEVIASLSIVASAAASDAATLSIISLALASLAGGVFIIGHNLWDLRDDCYKENPSQESNNEATTKYKELLGEVNYFPLHAFFAILSFLVFGMIPPVAYGYTFYETSDKDYTVAVVAIASLVCVSLLAIFKAYINKCTFFEYFKTIVYYITTAVSTSGVSYVAGNLFMRLIEEYGFFNTSSGVGVSLVPNGIIPSLASF